MSLKSAALLLFHDLSASEGRESERLLRDFDREEPSPRVRRGLPVRDRRPRDREFWRLSADESATPSRRR